MRDSTHKRSAALLISYVFNPNNHPEIGGGGYMASAVYVYLDCVQRMQIWRTRSPRYSTIRMAMVHRGAYNAYDSDVDHRQKKKRKSRLTHTHTGKLVNGRIS